MTCDLGGKRDVGKGKRTWVGEDRAVEEGAKRTWGRGNGCGGGGKKDVGRRK